MTQPKRNWTTGPPKLYPGYLQIRLTQEDHAAFMELCRGYGLTASDVTRTLIQAVLSGQISLRQLSPENSTAPEIDPA